MNKWVPFIGIIRYLHSRTSLTIKAFVFSLVTGLAIWFVMDYMHNKRVEEQYMNQTYERMKVETEEDMERFVASMKRLEIFTKLIKNTTSFIDYIDKEEVESMLALQYIMLTDPKGRIIKSLDKVEKPAISALVEQVSRYAILDKLFVTRISNEPFLILKKRVIDKTGALFGYVILLSRIDNNTMKKSYIIHPHDSIHALEDEDSSTIVASSQPDILPAGINVNKLYDYIIIRKSLSDISQGGIKLAFLSIKHKSVINNALKDIVARNRKQIALTATAFILFFSLFTYTFSRLIHKIALLISQMSKECLGIELYVYHKGDELIFITSQIKQLFIDMNGMCNSLQIASNKAMKFYQIVQQSPASIIITDTEANIEYVNPKFTEISGYAVEDIIGKRPCMLKSGIHTRKFYTKLWATILSGKTWQGEFFNKKKNGEFYWELSLIFPLIDDEGKIINYIAIKEDITSRKHLEREIELYKNHLEDLVAERTLQLIDRETELTNSKNTLLALMNSITESVMLIAKDGIILTINESGANRFGNTPHDMIGKNIFDFLPHDVSQNRRQQINRIINEGVSIEYEDTRAGYHFSHNLYPTFDKQGNVTSIAIFAIDVTERNRQERRALLFLQAVEATLDGINLADLEGRVFYSNKAAADMLGYSVDEIIGMSTSDFNDDPMIEEQAIIPAVLKEGSWGGELKAKRKDGTIITIWLSVSPIKDNNGDIIYTVGVSRDITSQKLYEETLKQYEDIVSVTSEHISIVDRDYVYKTVNKTYLAAHKRTKGEIVGHSVEELFGSKVFHDIIKPKLDKCLSGEVVNYQTWLDFAYIGRRYMDAYYHPYYNSHGVITGVVVSGRDITDKKQAEDDLKNIARFPAENPNPVLRVDGDAKIIYSNQSGVEFLNKWGITDTLPPYMHSAIEMAIENGVSDDIEITVSDGTTFLFSVVPIKESGYVNLYGREITKLKNTEAILKLQQEEIRKINLDLEQKIKEEVSKNRQKDIIMFQQSRLASMGEMVNYIAHQWRQPLNALNIMLFNIEDACNNSENDSALMNNLLADAKVIISNMSTTIDDFRNFFRQTKDKVPFCLSSIIQETLTLVDSSFKFHNIEVELTYNDKIYITGLANEYSQVILNVINNAKDAILERDIHEGKITIDCYEDNNNAVVTITDNAGGIPADIINRIFEPYFTTKTEGKGTGIGLYMSKTIIEEHMNGSITATNTSDGARFTITTPKSIPVAP
ncbi:MAG: PAS domain S-box protein [Nitrospirae bacterium]|uniref:PAS domain-containing sensor histidine kinase n=1 Tax=Candidatus Magnetobacterium casense TaxID=1455061 RepID=UPI000695B1EC|nr:PAS domain S-box protein [Candidatus Magnetobacterium casensis]MBF0337987.1 PAS domain S-box protein [Nitrospirota bacterium]